MTPVVAILGRPNVGKSTLFNQLTATRDALVIDQPGMTRDRRFGTASTPHGPWLVIDTGGLRALDEPARDETAPGRTDRALVDEASLDRLVDAQSLKAAGDADAVVLVVDVKDGLTAMDEHIASHLRRLGKPVVVVANKVDGADPAIAVAEFHQFGLGAPVPVSARSGGGIRALIDTLATVLPATSDADDPLETDEAGADTTDEDGIRIAIIGRPNVGKSTLTNRLLGEPRVIVSPIAGTTRDSIRQRFERLGRTYTFIDTAGIRRKSKVDAAAEKFSIVDAIKSINAAHIALVVIDATEGMTDQDAAILGLAVDSGRSIIIAVNKWDGLETGAREHAKRTVERKTRFCEYAEVRYISALHGSGTGKLFPAFDAAHAAAHPTLSTSAVTDLLYEAVESHPPPLVAGRRIKLRYAHLGGRNPPRIVIHGNQTEKLPKAYRRYLANFFREALNLVATPVAFEFRTAENPYKGRKNTLTPRQQRRRKRLLQHVKKR